MREILTEEANMMDMFMKEETIEEIMTINHIIMIEVIIITEVEVREKELDNIKETMNANKEEEENIRMRKKKNIRIKKQMYQKTTQEKEAGILLFRKNLEKDREMNYR
mmetsp:Transcript_21183/g.21967  ORF Transcript_21183/g.21967 Transcript_21183/m.21967 type:complete len:108 (+) Transcript_21183:476-799(+)